MTMSKAVHAVTAAGDLVLAVLATVLLTASTRAGGGDWPPYEY